MLLRVDMELTRKNFQSFFLVSAAESMYIFPKLQACPLAFSYLPPQNNLYLRARYLHRRAYSCLALPCPIKGPLHGNKKNSLLRRTNCEVDFIDSYFRLFGFA